MFNYPYSRSREALGTLARNGDPDACHGHKLRYVNPASGESAMPTIGAFMQLLPAGFASAPYRATDGTVFVVVEGEGETVISATLAHWLVAPGDSVSVGTPLAEIETEKALVEYAAEEAGIVARLVLGEGDTAEIGEAV